MFGHALSYLAERIKTPQTFFFFAFFAIFSCSHVQNLLVLFFSCSSIARATCCTHVLVCSNFSIALFVSTRACRCVLVHLLCIHIPTCLQLVTVRKHVWTDLCSHLSNAGPNTPLSATVVFVSGIATIFATHCIRINFRRQLMHEVATARHMPAPLARHTTRTGIPWILASLSAPPVLTFVRPKMTSSDVSHFIPCRPHAEVMRHVECSC